MVNEWLSISIVLFGCLGVVYVARLPENSTCHVSGASLQCGGEDHAVVVSEKLEFIGPVTWKMFPFGDVIITWSCCVVFAVSINFYYMLTPALTNEIINIQIKTKILLQFIFFHVEKRASNVENVSIWWRHHHLVMLCGVRCVHQLLLYAYACSNQWNYQHSDKN